MRLATKCVLALCTLVSLVAYSPVTIQSANAAIVASLASECRCGRLSCIRCRRQKRKQGRQCPKCNADVCELKVECVKEKRNCFEVDQKVICIPKISWPWKSCRKGCERPCCPDPCCDDCDCQCRCNNRCGRAKTVNVLTIKKYECKTCKYSWKVNEAPLPKTQKQMQDEYEEQLKNIQPVKDAQGPLDKNELYDPSGSDVPTPPLTNGKN